MPPTIRRLLKSPGFTLVALLTLGLGIGITTNMFAVLDALVLRKSPAPDSDRLVSVLRVTPRSPSGAMSPGDYDDYRRQNTAFRLTASYSIDSANLAEPGLAAERLPCMSAAADFFSVFGLSPELGRVYTEKDDEPGAGPVAVLSDGFWRRHFAADPGVLGRSMRIDGRPVTIIGVMPPTFDNPAVWGVIDFWRPQAYPGDTWSIRDNYWLSAIGRLKSGVSLAQARAEANGLAARLAREYPRDDAGSSFHLALWNASLSNPVTRKVNWLSMGLACFVLLIACANLANLQLARVSARARDHAVQLALGISRGGLVRHLLGESLVLSLLGGALGLALADWGVTLTKRSIVIEGIPGLIDISINGKVLAFALIASLFTGALFGAAPALFASRIDVNLSLKQGGRGSTGGRSRRRFRHGLIAAQMALTVVLLAGASFFVEGLRRFALADEGWKPDGLITANLVLPFNAVYSPDGACRNFVRRLESDLNAIPGSEAASVSAYLPIEGFWKTASLAAEGRPPPPEGREPVAYFDPITPRYFDTAGMRLLQGRGFRDSDRADSPPVAIVNQALARALWLGENPIGHRIGGADPAHRGWMQIVGVVGDVHPAIELVQASETAFQIYQPLAQVPDNQLHWLKLAVRSSAPPAVVADGIRQAVARIDPDEPVSDLLSAREAIRQELTAGFILLAKILGFFALGGLGLAAIGIYGVIANLVVLRTQEIGVRMALGAQKSDVLALILRQGAWLAAAGSAAGLACAFGLLRVLGTALPGLPGADPVTLVALCLLLVAVALFACWLPARRAARVDPIVALRSE